MKSLTSKYLIIALGLGILFHGTAMFFTLEETYDALIHLFFAEHYASNWSEPWSYKWYTGFTVMGYPPLVHQLLALLSFIAGLKFALFTFTLLLIILFITGVYRFSLVLTKNTKYAGFAAVFCVFSSVYIETLHVFGQLPTLMGVSLLLHVIPEVYNWVITHKKRYLISSLLLMAVMVCSHHVTPIFGMVFFIFPTLGLAILDKAKSNTGSYKEVKLMHFIKTLWGSIKQIIGFGLGSLILLIGCILPYWINTKNNPITQVPIPHGSRDNFLEVLSSGLVFFIIPYGIVICLLPYILYRLFSKRLICFGLSFSMLFLLGTGGTTPLPKLLLGENAFSILTLDRFTFWASIMSFPLVGELFYRLFKSDYKSYLRKQIGKIYYFGMVVSIGAIIAFFAVFTTNIGKFRPSQPQAIKMLPIVNFLNQDMHYKWRYLTLGFGDQMAWLSSQTNALTVDGNYHSARRLPELTTKAVERLENSKFRGIEGIGSLQQFLSNSNKFHLKYVFSNDKFYDPILFFTGWEKLVVLENNIVVWEKQNIDPLPTLLPRIDVADFQKIIWSFIPISMLIMLLLWTLLRYMFFPKLTDTLPNVKPTSLSFVKPMRIWNLIVFLTVIWFMQSSFKTYGIQNTPEHVVKHYYDALDFNFFEKAHSYLDMQSHKTLDQFMLEIAVSDGVLSSYAKLDSIVVKELNRKGDTCIVKAQTKWITPLESIDKTEEFKTIKRKDKWYIIPKEPSKYIPSNQFFDTPKVEYYNQGRRKITTQQTHHEDILPQPVVYVLNASLIQKDSAYHVIGEIQNLDYFPASIQVKAELYDGSNNLLASFSPKFQSKYNLSPYEVVPFKIDFEEIAWLTTNKSSESFNPQEFHPKEFKTIPNHFVIHVSSTVSTKNLYNAVQISAVQQSDNQNIIGELYNSGNKEVTIPQILISYKEASRLRWVDHAFVKTSIRPHRKVDFLIKPKLVTDIKVLKSTTKDCFINGMPNNEIEYIKDLSVNRLESTLDKNVIQNNNIQLKVNNFIGND
ncbi:6-pyruvoyl-tetrahydropterin synthase-related protein [Pseudofulvibacter geojedonensis]|uniref:6-pyruvoyl-tetrahydropterin synthase-related protein n=1 Tax=Pseudofulvibacter geojedonensis TaxID=1123758 RepID=A0ABW3I4Z5_9FLAO